MTPLAHTRLGFAPLTERHVQAIWYDEALRPKELHTTTGVPFTVKDPGIWNLEAGPDFHHALLEVGPEKKPLSGDVEVHLHPADWQQHAHTHNPAYQHVIAHLTWYAGPPAQGLPPDCLSVCLGSFMRTRADFSPDEIDLSAYPYAKIPPTPRPCAAFFVNQPDFLVDILAQAGTARLLTKAQRLKTRLVRAPNLNQLVYEEMMSALGYKKNARAFRTLAQIVPWCALPSDPLEALTILSSAANMEVDSLTPFVRDHVRPANSQSKRLASAARLFAGTEKDLVPLLFSFSLNTKEGARAALQFLKSRTQMGAPRVAAILSNILIPLALAQGLLHEVPSWLCPEDLSAPMRLTAFRLLGRDHNPHLYTTNGLLQQGLLALHHAFCLASSADCSNCKLVSQLHTPT